VSSRVSVEMKPSFGYTGLLFVRRVRCGRAKVTLSLNVARKSSQRSAIVFRLQQDTISLNQGPKWIWEFVFQFQSPPKLCAKKNNIFSTRAVVRL
jgi:hypothetical protein